MMSQSAGHWHVAFLFSHTMPSGLHYLQLQNADARMNILSITTGYREYTPFVAHIHHSVTTLPRPPSRLERDEIWAVDSQENL